MLKWRSQRFMGNAPVLRYTLAAMLLQLVLAVPLVLTATFMTPGDTQNGITPAGDVVLYSRFAAQAIAGQVPYRQFSVEYPVAAFALFLIPGLAGKSVATYAIVFVLELLAISSVVVYAIARFIEQRDGIKQVPGRLLWYTSYLLALGPVVFARFDIVPAALAFLAALYWSAGRPAAGGVLAGLGTFVKIFPALVAGPALLVAIRDRQWRGAAAFVLSIAAGFCGWLALAGANIWDFVRFHAQRGLEIESVYAGVLMALGRIFGAAMGQQYFHGSHELRMGGAGELAALSLGIQCVLIVTVLFRFHRAGMIDPLRYSAACVLAFIIGSKVLSPQFLIWMCPFIVILNPPSWRRVRWTFLCACALSTAVFPFLFHDSLLQFRLLGLLALNVRNWLLIYLFYLLLRTTGGRGEIRRISP